MSFSSLYLATNLIPLWIDSIDIRWSTEKLWKNRPKLNSYLYRDALKKLFLLEVKKEQGRCEWKFNVCCHTLSSYALSIYFENNKILLVRKWTYMSRFGPDKDMSNTEHVF